MTLSAQLVAAALLFTAAPMTAHAQALTCSDLFAVQAVDKPKAVNEPKQLDPFQDARASLKDNYEKRNEILSKRYQQLEFVFKDPEAFVHTMRERFEAQKKITPEDPRVFNFPEAASTMKEVSADLVKFHQELTNELSTKKQSPRNRVSQVLRGKESSKVQTINKVLQYVEKLQKDIDQMISSNHYPYRDTVYSVYYYSRIRGIFQFKELNTYYHITKYIDMVMHGYRRLNIDDELRLYETKGSPILQVRSGKIAHEFRVAELPFRDAFERTDILEYVLIPSVYALGSSAMMHVLPHRIHLLGATNTPVAADGFKRPGGLFWMHDVRHEADRYMKVSAYRKAQNLTTNQEKLLSLYSQLWHADFLKMKNSVADENLKAALDHYHFYTHHDVGVPLVPSMFLNHHKDGREVFYAFLFHKKMAGQTPAFNKWVKTTKEAEELLIKFWQDRLPIEKKLLGKDPVQIKNWEEWFPMSHQSKSLVSVFNKAIETGSLVRLRTDNSGVDGVLSKVIYSQQGEPIYMQFTGKAQLIDRANQVIAGQGPESHSEGYSSPIGRIKSVKIDGGQGSLSQLHENQKVEIEYESGIVVRGDLKNATLDGSNNLTVLTFTTAEVVLNDKILYNPAWGKFDLILGEKVQSLEFL